MPLAGVTYPALFRVVNMDVSRGMVVINNPKARKDELNRDFTFDAVYDWK